MATLSVVIITHNEERNIAACLESVKWAEEKIVVDSFSSDRTCELAAKYTTKIFQKEWTGFGPTKAYALTLARCDWVLSLDADERVSDELAEEIKGVLALESNPCDGYLVKRKAYFLGRWIRHCGWYPGYVLRLFRRDKGEFSQAIVHERVLISGKTNALKSGLLHLTDPNLDHYFQKFNRFTTLGAAELRAKRTRATWADLSFRPLLTFVSMYLLRGGFLDGFPGFLLSYFSAYAVFCKYAKLWEMDLLSRSQLS